LQTCWITGFFTIETPLETVKRFLQQSLNPNGSAWAISPARWRGLLAGDNINQGVELGFGLSGAKVQHSLGFSHAYERLLQSLMRFRMSLLGSDVGCGNRVHGLGQFPNLLRELHLLGVHLLLHYLHVGVKLRLLLQQKPDGLRNVHCFIHVRQYRGKQILGQSKGKNKS
jgi:hypothetical protein